MLLSCHESHKSHFLKIGFCALVVLLFSMMIEPTCVHAGEITLAWDASTDAQVTGYKIYYGMSTRNYTYSVDVGNVTSYSLANLEGGKIYFFAATAYDLNGNESDFSEEIVCNTPLEVQDSDGDGISDDEEVGIFHSDPMNPDTDGDGVWDGEELAFWADNWNGDGDADGIVNFLDTLPYGQHDEREISASVRSKLAALEGTLSSGDYSFAVGYNSAVELPIENLCGLVEPENWQTYSLFTPIDSGRSLPATFDWRTREGVSPVREQGSCAGDWAFATTAVLESQIKIQCGLNEDLSEQYLISCNENNWGCDGGWFAQDYHEWYSPYSETEAGAVSESAFPYESAEWRIDHQTAQCGGPLPHPYKIDSWSFIAGQDNVASAESIKQAIYQYGPVAAAVCAGPNFQAYKAGVFDYDETDYCRGGVNHAIVIVGWEDDGGMGDGFWIVKNSWGTDWGESGYMRIRQGISKVGYAANYIEFADCEAEISPANGATLSASPQSAQAAGHQVTFTAAGQGGTGTYEYRFWLYGPSTGNTWQIMQDYSAQNTWRWSTTGSDVGQNYISVWVRNAGSVNNYEAGTGSAYQINWDLILAASGATVTASPQNAQAAGHPVTFTAGGTGGTGQYEYRFWLNGPSTGNTWEIMQDYSSANSWVWPTSSQDAGQNTVSVWVRSAGSASIYEAGTGMMYQINQATVTAATGASLTASPQNFQDAGYPVTFTAAGIGGTGQYEYRFWLNGPSTGNTWKIMQDFSTANSWVWPTSSQDAGQNTVSVWVRSAGSGSVYEAGTGTMYQINLSAVTAATGASLTASPKNSQAAGNTVIFTAGGIGGTGQYEYRFWLNGPSTGNTWKIMQDFSTANSWIWHTSCFDVGQSAVSVWVRSAGSGKDYESGNGLYYTIQ